MWRRLQQLSNRKHRAASLEAAFFISTGVTDVTFKESVLYAIKTAHKQKKEFVVGKEDGRWEVRELADPRSDQMSPSIIVTGKGIKYPDDEYLYAQLIEEGA